MNKPIAYNVFLRFDLDETIDGKVVHIFREDGLEIWAGTREEFRDLLYMAVDESQRVP